MINPPKHNEWASGRGFPSGSHGLQLRRNVAVGYGSGDLEGAGAAAELGRGRAAVVPGGRLGGGGRGAMVQSESKFRPV